MNQPETKSPLESLDPVEVENREPPADYVARITENICAYYELAPADLDTAIQQTDVAMARMIRSYLVHRRTGDSYDVAASLIDQPVSSIRYANHKIRQRLDGSADPRLARDLAVIEHSPAPPAPLRQRLLDGVCATYGTSEDEIISRTKVQHVARARLVLMFVLAEQTFMSNATIADYLGRTASSAGISIAGLRRQIMIDQTLADQVEAIITQRVETAWTPEGLVRQTAEYYDIPLEQLSRNRVDRNAMRARHAAVVALQQHGLSRNAISRAIGSDLESGRISRQWREDPTFVTEVNDIVEGEWAHRPITRSEVLEAVSTYYRTDSADLLGHRQSNRLVRQRHAARLLLHELCGLSTASIGRTLHRSKHSVASSLDSARRLRDTDPGFRQELADIARWQIRPEPELFAVGDAVYCLLSDNGHLKARAGRVRQIIRVSQGQQIAVDTDRGEHFFDPGDTRLMSPEKWAYQRRRIAIVRRNASPQPASATV